MRVDNRLISLTLALTGSLSAQGIGAKALSLNYIYGVIDLEAHKLYLHQDSFPHQEGGPQVKSLDLPISSRFSVARFGFVNATESLLVYDKVLRVIDNESMQMRVVPDYSDVSNIVIHAGIDHIFLINANSLLRVSLKSFKSETLIDIADVLQKMSAWYEVNTQEDFYAKTDYYQIDFDEDAGVLYLADSHGRLFSYNGKRKELAFLVKGSSPQIVHSEDGMELYCYNKEAVFRFRPDKSLNMNPLIKGDIARYRVQSPELAYVVFVKTSGLLKRPYLSGFSIFRNGELTEVEKNEVPNDVFFIGN